MIPQLRKFILPLSVFGIQLALFRDLLSNITTNLIDWRDYSLLVWVLGGIQNNILSANILNFFDGNMYFPNKFTLLFADSFYPQVIPFMASFGLSKNLVFSFNVVFFLTLLLNTFGAWSLWKALKIKRQLLLFFAVLVTSLSPFFFSELSHFQMISFWPLLFSLSFLFRLQNEPTKKNIILVITFGIIQFYASVYIFTYLLTIFGIYYVIELLFASKKKRVAVFWQGFKIAVGIGIGVLPMYLLYYYIQHLYQAERQYFEYVLYAAHFTDYAFPNTWSALSSFAPFKVFSKLNHHFVGEPALFPGFVLSVLGGFGLIKTLRLKNKTSLFFAALLLVGFVFSLGPKLNINGKFIGWPLPYVVPLKLMPLYWPLRATKRWSFLLYTSLAYFSVAGLQLIAKKYPKRASLILLLIVGIYVLEMFPMQYKSEYKDYYPEIYSVLETECKDDPKVLLEYPMEENHAEANVATNLSYKTTFMVASLRHKCNLINGYSGLVPPKSLEFQQTLQTVTNADDVHWFSKLLSENNISIIKINEPRLSLESKTKILELLEEANEFKLSAQDATTKVYLRTDE